MTIPTALDGDLMKPIHLIILHVIIAAHLAPASAWGCGLGATSPPPSSTFGHRICRGFHDSKSVVGLWKMSNTEVDGAENSRTEGSSCLVLPAVVVGTFQLKGDVVKTVVRESLAQVLCVCIVYVFIELSIRVFDANRKKNLSRHRMELALWSMGTLHVYTSTRAK